MPNARRGAFFFSKLWFQIDTNSWQIVYLREVKRWFHEKFCQEYGHTRSDAQTVEEVVKIR